MMLAAAGTPAGDATPAMAKSLAAVATSAGDTTSAAATALAACTLTYLQLNVVLFCCQSS